MVEKFFLALDYPNDDDAINACNLAVKIISNEYGGDFIRNYIGIKVNEDSATGQIDRRYREISENNDIPIFADMKIGHGPDNGEKILGRLVKDMPFRYVTVSGVLGSDILKEYVKIAKKLEADVIAWTVHTKTSELDALEIYGRPISDVIYSIAKIAKEAGCDAAVMEAKMLREERVRDLPIKKLVTGVRIDTSDTGAQRRVSSLKELTELSPYINYVVVSSRYLGDPSKLKQFFDSLKSD
jgi:orotidine-5'-phosphate decarboxylase